MLVYSVTETVDHASAIRL